MSQELSILSALLIQSIFTGCIAFAFYLLHKQYPIVYNPRKITTPIIRMLLSPDIEVTGVDGYLLLLFLRLILWMFVAFGIFGLLILMPINSSGEENLDGLDKLSMANIEQGSDLIWAHLISAYVYTAIACYLTIGYTEQAKRIRYDHLKKPAVENHTVLVQGIPAESRTVESIRYFFDPIYPGQLVNIAVAQHVPVLPSLIEERLDIIEKLEEALAKASISSSPPKVSTGFCGICGPEVDAVAHYRYKLKEISTRINQIRETETFPPATSGTAFITFSDALSAISASQSVHHYDSLNWVVSSAPQAEDIYWENINVQSTQRYVLTLLGEAVTFLVIFFYAIPISFIAALSNSEALSEDLPFLEPLVENDISKALIEGILPAALLLLLDIFTPVLLSNIAKFEGALTYTDIEGGLLRKFYGLQIYNIFFVTTIAGSIFDSLSDMIDDPAEIPDLLGSSLPQVSSFFIIYILLQTLISLPANMLRIGPLLTYHYTHTIGNTTEAQKDNSVRPDTVSFGRIYPELLLVLLISLTYSTIAPVVIPIAFAFFAMSYFVRSYELVYLSISRCDTGGKFWPLATRRLVFALIVYQITLTGYFSIKIAVAQVPFMTPLIAATTFFYYYMERRYYNIWEYLPLSEVSQNPKLSKIERAYIVYCYFIISLFLLLHLAQKL
eukprot:TRINITY_DN6381_c0_g1_i2.p1 TRINITY_DN6381_c0_g1~~TRINITY_DN6381_c0_g1_i2.p1  ORF type:complete len:671 (+),score=105.10 TRINITY_DN6381_c0_g1_i2:52-2064(+)